MSRVRSISSIIPREARTELRSRTTVVDSTAFAEILHEVEEGVLTLTLNRPHRRNAITTVMLAELIFALEQATDDKRVRVVVLRGADHGFCPGDDLNGMGPLPEDFKFHPQGSITHVALQRSLMELPKPTIAVLHGYAFGVGLDLAMACDFRIAADDVVLQDQRVIERGMHAVTGCAWFQPRAMGVPRALEFLILGEPMNGAEASAHGMVTRSVPAAELEQTVSALTARLANAPTRAIGLMKRQIYRGEAMDHESFMEWAAPLVRDVLIRDREEGIRAFLEKRPPQFTGD
jgi:2-(1,2-epoxy-1,2-dihydrophenyl)acetyl-CoA isomerase